MLLVCDTEPDGRYSYFPEALHSHVPADLVVDYTTSTDTPPISDVDAVILTGSSAGVYETDDRPWIRDASTFVRELVSNEVPTLGVCFGHQLVNAALGGRVEAGESVHRLVEVSLSGDPLFDGVNARIPAVHGDYVRDPGEKMAVIAAADHYPAFATRHETAPIWTVQYHPEFTVDLLAQVRSDFGWDDTDLSFEAVTAVRTFENFLRLAGVQAECKTQ